MTQPEYEQKHRECREEFWHEVKGSINRCPETYEDLEAALYTAFDRAYAIGKKEKDAEGEEMLTVNRKRVLNLYNYHKLRGHHLAAETLLKLFDSKFLPKNVDSLGSNVDSSHGNVDNLYQITDLAREYAEFTNLSPIDKKNVRAICECFLMFIYRRFCLVEKERVRKLVEYAQGLIEARDYNKQCIGGGSQGILLRLFPKIAKKVEA